MKEEIKAKFTNYKDKFKNYLIVLLLVTVGFYSGQIKLTTEYLSINRLVISWAFDDIQDTPTYVNSK